MKKLLSMILVLAMVFSLAVPALAAEPTVTGDSEGDVKASFAPEIAITGLSFEAENIYYDQATNTYVIPLFEDPLGAIDFTEVYSGKNLKYFADAENVLLQATLTMDGESRTVQVNLAEYVAAGGEMFTYDADTGMLKGEMAAPGEFKMEYQYSNDNGKTWSDPVTIETKRVYEIIIEKAITNGTVTADKAFAGAGETVTLTVTPDEGYELVLLDYINADPDAEFIPMPIENNQFVMPAYNVVIHAGFEKATKTYTVTLSDTIVNGTVTTEGGKTSFTAGETVTLNIAPEAGYELDKLTVNGVDVTANVENGKYSFPMGDANVEVNATFKKIAYTVTLPETVVNGAVTIEGDKPSFTAGETVTLNVTPAEGYALDKLIVNGVDVTADVVNGKYSFTMGDANVEITTTFKKNVYAIEIGNFVGGSVTADMETAAVGQTVTLTVSTTGKYQLKSIAVVDALEQPVVFTEENEVSGTYKFVMPASDVTVEAEFEEILTTSADIAWGSLSFTYTDGENGAADGAWSCEEDANKITVTNNGDNGFSVQPHYNAEKEYEEIEGRFYESMDAEQNYTMGYSLNSGEIVEFYLKLFNQPNKAIPAGTKIGSVTIEITEGFGE